MDERLKLNRKQKVLVKKLARLFDEMKEENLGIVLQDGYMLFLNKSVIMSIEKEENEFEDWPADNDDTWLIDKDEVHLFPLVEDYVPIPHDEMLGEGDAFYVSLTPSTDEEFDELASSRAAEQASLKNRLSFLKDKYYDDEEKNDVEEAQDLWQSKYYDLLLVLNPLRDHISEMRRNTLIDKNKTCIEELDIQISALQDEQ